MQAYLPIIQDLLSDWYQFTIDNAVYAASLAASVWLLSAVFYRTRIAFLNRSNRATAKAIQNSIDAAQQQIQTLQEELNVSTERMQKAEIAVATATQHALALEKCIGEHNRQLADSFQTLTADFDLGRSVLPAEDDFEAVILWQQYSSAVTQLAERLRAEQQSKIELQQAYQAETAQLADKEMLLGTLQTQLHTQAHQLAKLEEHNTLLRQQHENAQQQLSDTLQKHQADLTRLAELEQQSLAWAHTKQQQSQRDETTNAQAILIAQLEQTEQTQPSVINQDQHAPIELEKTEAETPAQLPELKQPPLTPVENQANDITGKLKHLFGSAMQQIAKLDEKLADKTTIDKITEEPQPVLTENALESSQSDPSNDDRPLPKAVKEQFNNVTGKVKTLWGSARKSPAAESRPAFTVKQPEVAAPPVPETAQQPPMPSSDAMNGIAGASKKILAQLRSLGS